MTKDLSKVKVLDPFGAAADPQLPTVALALDRAKVRAEFKRALPRLTGPGAVAKVRAIRVTRHKPGKRAVIEYEMRLKRDGVAFGSATLVGKIRARRFGNEAYRLLDQLWNAGFSSDAADGIAVPEPIAVIPRFRMWLQRKVPGEVAWPVLAGPDGVALARRIAEAIHKLHRAGVPTPHAHTMADELRILHQCVPRVLETHPGWAGRVEKLLASCDRLAASLAAPRVCGIHRDFYPAQVLVDGPRLHLLDFDLYCEGDPGLDVGNFLAHVTEESLRTLGHPTALRDREQAMEDRFVELTGEAVRRSVRVYYILTLVRHVYLSTQFAARTHLTEPLLTLSEAMLDPFVGPGCLSSHDSKDRSVRERS